MIGLVLLLTAGSITLTNGIPTEVSSPYLEYPEEYKENYKNLNYFNLPKTSYELRPQLQSHSKRNSKGVAYDVIMNEPRIPSYGDPNDGIRGPSWPDEAPQYAGPGKKPTSGDIMEGKRSFKSQELYEKLVALGLDHIGATNIIEDLHRLQRKIDSKNAQ